MTKYRIQFMNVWRWFVDQASHPKTFFYKKSWGVFSEYAHIRRSDRLPKKSADTKIQAQKTADFMAKKYGGSYSIYKCVYCDGWHVAKDSNGETPKLEPIVKPMVDVPTTVDVDMMQNWIFRILRRSMAVPESVQCLQYIKPTHGQRLSKQV